MELNGWCSVLLDRSHIQQRLALGLVNAGQTGDVHPFVATVGAQGAQTDATVGLPDLYRPFTAAAGQKLAIGGQRQAVDASCMALQRHQRLSVVWIPEARRPILRAAGHELRV